jgi:hypothetical protein
VLLAITKSGVGFDDDDGRAYVCLWLMTWWFLSNEPETEKQWQDFHINSQTAWFLKKV